MHFQEAAIVAVDDVIGVLSRLLGRRHVLRVLRDIFDRAIGSVKDPHQRRNDGLYGIPYIHADHLTATLLLVAERLAPVVLRRGGAHWRHPVVNKVDCVVDLVADNALQLRFVHCVRVQFSLKIRGHFVYFIVHLVAPTVDFGLDSPAFPAKVPLRMEPSIMVFSAGIRT